jgi:hypothetical protein
MKIQQKLESEPVCLLCQGDGVGEVAMIATLGCPIDGQVLTTTPGFHTSSIRRIAGLV